MTIERLEELKNTLYEALHYQESSRDWNAEEQMEKDINKLIDAEIERQQSATVKDILDDLNELSEYEDYEWAHHKADILLCELLLYLGHEEVVDAWENVGKYYS